MVESSIMKLPFRAIMAAKVLIVDGDSGFRSELRDTLSVYDVAEVRSGEEAFSLLKKANDIGVVLLDVRMPGQSGIDILTRLKKTDPNLHIIIMTDHGSKDFVIDALKAHADDFIEKPIDPRELIGLVEDALNRKDYGQSDPEAADIDDKIKKVERFVERNCYKKTTLEDAAASVYLSPKYLSRIFKEKTKKSFSQFRIGTKIGKAKELLAKRGYNINQISEKLGYENTESFIRQFKKFTKMTPTAFRGKMEIERRRRSRPRSS